MPKNEPSAMMKLLNMLGGKNRLSWRSPACFFWLTTTSTALVLYGTLTGDQWVSLAQWIGGLFMGTEAVRVFSPKEKPPEGREVDPPTEP